MGKGSNTTTTAPPKEMMDYYRKVFGRAEKAANAPYKPYTGELVAPMSGLERQAMAGVSAASNAYKPYFAQAQQYGQQAGQGVTPWSAEAMQKYESPYNEQVTKATMDQLGELQGRQRQDVVGSAISQGAWGGDRAGVAQAEMARQQGMAAGQTLAGLNQGNYQQAMGAFTQQQGVEAQQRQMEGQLAQSYGSMGVAAQNAALQGIQSQAQLGASERAQRQAMDQARMQMFSQRQQYPFTTTQFMAGIGQGLGPGMGSSVTQPEPSIFSQIGGLALGGLSMYGGGMFGKARGGRVGYAHGGAVAGFPVRRGYASGGVPDLYDMPVVQPFLDPRADPNILGATQPPVIVDPARGSNDAGTVGQYAVRPAAGVVAPARPAPMIPWAVTPAVPAPGVTTPYTTADTATSAPLSINNPIIAREADPLLSNPSSVVTKPSQPNIAAGLNAAVPAVAAVAGAVDPTTTGSTPAANDNAGLWGVGRDKWQGLAAMGFGMAAGDSPFFGVNAGKGGMAMLQTMQQQREADRLQRAQDIAAANEKANREELHQYHQETLAQQEAQRQFDIQKSQMPEWKKVGSDPLGNDIMDWVYPGKTPEKAASAFSASGDDAEPGALYAQLPDTLKTRVDGMLAGNEPIPRNTKNLQGLISAADDRARELGSPLGFDKVLWQQKLKTRASFTSGNDSKTVQSGNNAAQAIGVLTDAIQALPDAPFVGDNVPVLSGLARQFNEVMATGTETSDAAAYSDFDAVKNTVAEEINKFSRGSTGAEADISRVLENLSKSKSKHELLAATHKLMDVINTSENSLQGKWHDGMGKDAPDFEVFKPESVAARDKITSAYEDSVKRVKAREKDPAAGGGKPAAADAAAGATVGATVALPEGTERTATDPATGDKIKLVVKGGKLVPVEAAAPVVPVPPAPAAPVIAKPVVPAAPAAAAPAITDDPLKPPSNWQ